MSTQTGSQQFTVSIGGSNTGMVATGNNIEQENRSPTETAEALFIHLPADQRTQLQQLRQQIMHSFDESELRTLGFDLGIRYDDLEGDIRQDKVRELLLYCLRHGRLDELVTALVAARPHLDWT
ncbi:MAG: hypothetical protein R6X32_17710 [Chloroflexota bacterium]|jgi:hypothetical protein